MSWKGVTVMDQRVRFISEYLNAYFPFTELCTQFEKTCGVRLGIFGLFW